MSIQPRIQVFDIETLDSVDTIKAPEPVPCMTFFDTSTNTYHIFCYGFKKHELALVMLRLQQHWQINLIPKLLKYNFSNPRLIFHSQETEKQMFGDLLSFINNNRPDIIAPWNRKFDMPYIVQRMKNLGLPYNALSEVQKVYYNTKDETVTIQGTTECDLMEHYIYSLPQAQRSTSLDFCANKEFGTGKMKRPSIKEMRLKDPVGLLAYNIIDIQLSYALMDTCQLLSNMQTIERISNAGLDNQSPLRIIDSFIMTFLKNRKIAVPTNIYKKRDEKKEGGAYVHSASIGKHNNIIVLDFKSYYTSVMMDGNVCASTVVTIDEIKQSLPVNNEIQEYIHKNYIHCPNGALFRKDKIGVIPEILVHVREERNRHKKLMKNTKDEQERDVEDRLQNGFKRIGNISYGQFKNTHFRLMDKAIAEAITSVCKVLTIKVIDILEQINAQDLLSKFKSEIPENEFNSLHPKLNIFLKIIYGDSVTKETVILIKDINNNIFFKKIEDIFKNIDYKHGEKEYYLPQNLQTLTIKDGKSVWRPIKNVMRHKTNKQIKNVSITNQWNINVTEDHSLIGYLNVINIRKKGREQIIEVKPNEIGKECKTLVTLKYIPRINILSRNYPKELYQFMGLFIGNGSYNVKYGEKNYYLYLSNDKEKAKDIIEKVLIPLKESGFIVGLCERKNGYDMSISGHHLCEIMDDFRNLNGKTIPPWIFDETDENLSYFISGLFDSDGSISKRKNGYIITYTSIKENLLKDIQKILWFISIPSGICKENRCNKYLGKTSGTYSYRLNIRNNFNFKEKIEYITEKKKKMLNNVVFSSRKQTATINEFDTSGNISVKNIEYDDYVYDLEVEDTHTFFANGFLAHNTDSLMIKLPDVLSGSELRIIGKIIEKFINSLLPSLTKELFNIERKYIEIEFDDKKIMKSFIQMPKQGDRTEGAKKRYIYLSYNDDNTLNPDPHFVGVDVMRSDTSPLMVEVQTKLARMILNDEPYSNIRKYLLNLYNTFNKQSPDSLLIKETLHQFENIKSNSPQVVGALYANKYMQKSFKSGSMVYYLYLKSFPTGYPRMETDNLKALCLDYNESVPKNFLEHIDWKKMKDIVLIKPTETILEAVDYKWSEIITGTKENKVKAMKVTTTL